MAQNKETSIGVRLVADLRNYQKNLSTAQKQTKTFKNNVKNNVGDVKNSFQALMRGDITALPGFFRSATTASGGFAKGLKGVKAALISTGIGAILVGLGMAIGAVTQYFKGTEEGQIVFKKVMNNIKAYTEPVLQMFGKFGKAIVQLFKGDFEGAWETAKSAVKDVGTQIEVNRGQVAQLNAAEEKYIKLKRQNLIANKRLEAEINEARRIANDEDNYSAAQRAKAINEAIAKQKQLAANKKQELDLETQIAETKASFGDNDIETNDALAELKARQFDIISEQERAIKRMGEDQQRINREVKAEVDARERTLQIQKEQNQMQGLKTIGTRTVNSIETQPVDTSQLASVGNFLDANTQKANQLKKAMAEALGNEKYGAWFSNLNAGFQQLGNGIVSSLGLASEGFEGFLGTLISGVLQMIATYSAQALAAAIAGSSSAAAATGPLAPVTLPVFLAEMTGLVLGAFAKLPKFATGGVVGGSSFFGDNVIARLNSGEEVLTRDDPRHRNNQMQGGSAEPMYLPADVDIKDDFIRISYERARRRMRARTGK